MAWGMVLNYCGGVPEEIHTKHCVSGTDFEGEATKKQ